MDASMLVVDSRRQREAAGGPAGRLLFNRQGTEPVSLVPTQRDGGYRAQRWRRVLCGPGPRDSGTGGRGGRTRHSTGSQEARGSRRREVFEVVRSQPQPLRGPLIHHACMGSILGAGTETGGVTMSICEEPVHIFWSGWLALSSASAWGDLIPARFCALRQGQGRASRGLRGQRVTTRTVATMSGPNAVSLDHRSSTMFSERGTYAVAATEEGDVKQNVRPNSCPLEAGLPPLPPKASGAARRPCQPPRHTLALSMGLP